MLRLGDFADKLHTRGLHRPLLEPAVGGFGHHHHESGRIILVTPLGDGRGDLGPGEILILEIEESLPRGYHVNIERLDLHSAGFRVGEGWVRTSRARWAPS